MAKPTLLRKPRWTSSSGGMPGGRRRAGCEAQAHPARPQEAIAALKQRLPADVHPQPRARAVRTAAALGCEACPLGTGAGASSLLGAAG